VKSSQVRRIVGYERLSSKEQAFNSPAREQQRTRLETAGATEIFEDIESGRNDDRPQLQKLMALVANHDVDEVLITRIDRLGRSVPKVRECVSIFKEANVNLRILDQQIDLNSTHGMLVLNMLSAVAEMESDMISDRVNHGKQHRRNKKAACESYPWGYRVVNDKYELDNRPFLCLIEERPPNYLDFYRKSEPYKKEDLGRDKEDKLVELQVLRELSPKQLAEELVAVFFEKRSVTGTLKFIFDKYGISKTIAKTNAHSQVFYFSSSGLTRWLTNPVICGHTVYNKSILKGKKRQETSPEHWQIIQNTHPNHRLLTDEDAEEIQHILSANQKLVGENFNRPLGSTVRQEYSYQSGLVYCGECGSRCTSKTSTSKGKTYSYFACRHSGLGCRNSQSVEKQKIEESLIKYLVKTSRSLHQDIGGNNQWSVAPLESNRLSELKAQLEAAKNFPGFNINNEKLKQELQQQIEEETNSFSSLTNKTVEELIRRGNNLLLWQTLSNEDKVAIYHRLVHKIFLHQGEVTSILLKKSTRPNLNSQ
jgi:site-specific DNA recombinase